MSYRVVGIEDVNYVSKKTGQPVSGVNLHVTFPLNEQKGEGEAVEKIYCKQSLEGIDSISVGDDVEIYYNRFGGVEEIRLA